MSAVLLTGATGLIGGYAAGALERRGLEVRGVGSAAGDLTTPGAPTALATAASAELLLHAAWDLSPGYGDSHANRHWVAASLELLRAFASGGGRRALLVGTCAEYDPAAFDAPVREDAPLRPRDRYGRAKRDLWRSARALAEETGIEIAWARPFFVFDGNERPGRLVADVLGELLAGRPARVRAGGLVRDYLPARDVGEALAAIAVSGVKGAVNVGSGHGVSLGELARAAGRAAGREDLVRVGSEWPPGEPAEIVADPTRLRDEVGWSTALDLDAALAEAMRSRMARA